MKAKLEKFMDDISATWSSPNPDGDEAFKICQRPKSIKKMLPIRSCLHHLAKRNPSGDWSYANFHMVPAVGAVTLMDKYINDVKELNLICD
jgi:hypothetical protein